MSAEVFDSARFTNHDSVPDSQFIEISDTLRNLSSRSEALQGCHLAARSVALCQRLYPENPNKYAEWLVAALNTYSERLSKMAKMVQIEVGVTIQSRLMAGTGCYHHMDPKMYTQMIDSVRRYRLFSSTTKQNWRNQAEGNRHPSESRHWPPLSSINNPQHGDVAFLLPSPSDVAFFHHHLPAAMHPSSSPIFRTVLCCEVWVLLLRFAL